MVLYICGNHSTILSRLDRRFQDLEIRRAFTVFQLMTILEVVRHYWIIIECDPLLYEDATGMIDLASQEMSDAAKEAAVLLYSPGTDTILENLTRNADRVFYFDEGPRASTKLISKAYPRAQKSQTTPKRCWHIADMIIPSQYFIGFLATSMICGSERKKSLLIEGLINANSNSRTPWGLVSGIRFCFL
jgi:hypothetical protein